DAAHELLHHRLRVTARCGLRDDLHRAERKRVQCGLAVRRGHRAEDDDRYRGVHHQSLEQVDAVHARHLDIERDHVGRQPEDLFARVVRVLGHAHDFDVVLGGQLALQDRAYDGRVVDDEDPDHDVPAGAASRKSSSSARLDSRPSSIRADGVLPWSVSHEPLTTCGGMYSKALTGCSAGSTWPQITLAISPSASSCNASGATSMPIMFAVSRGSNPSPACTCSLPRAGPENADRKST